MATQVYDGDISLNTSQIYDTSELVPIVDWCIVQTGEPLGDQARNLDGYFGKRSQIESIAPRFNYVLIGSRKGSNDESYAKLRRFAESKLGAYGITYGLFRDERIHDYPWIVLDLKALAKWVDVLREARVHIPPVRPLAAPYEEMEYPDPHDQPYEYDQPQIRYIIARARLARALGVDAYSHRQREGWHIEMRGDYAALRLGGHIHTNDDVAYLYQTYGIATTVMYGGYELGVDPRDALNAHLRIS